LGSKHLEFGEKRPGNQSWTSAFRLQSSDQTLVTLRVTLCMPCNIASLEELELYFTENFKKKLMIIAYK
jgi:hypothetical protein